MGLVSREAREQSGIAQVLAPHGERRTHCFGHNRHWRRLSFRRLIDIAKLRWRIERDYQELKILDGAARHVDLAPFAPGRLPPLDPARLRGLSEVPVPSTRSTSNRALAVLKHLLVRRLVGEARSSSPNRRMQPSACRQEWS